MDGGWQPWEERDGEDGIDNIGKDRAEEVGEKG